MKWKTKRTIASLLACITLLSNTNYVYAINNTNDVDGKVLNEQTIENGNSNSDVVNIDNQDSENTSDETTEDSCEHTWEKSCINLEYVDSYDMETNSTGNAMTYAMTGTNGNIVYESKKPSRTEIARFKTTTYADATLNSTAYKYEGSSLSSSNSRYAMYAYVYVYDMDGNKISNTSSFISNRGYSTNLKINIPAGEHYVVFKTYQQYSYSDFYMRIVMGTGMYAYDICTKCHKAQQHDWDVTIKKEANCWETGLQDKVCKLCGEEVKDEVIPAKGHHTHGYEFGGKHETATSDDTWYPALQEYASEVIPHTCTESTWYVFKCDDCDYTLKTHRYIVAEGGSREANDAGHDVENSEVIREVAEDGICYGYAYTEYKCPVCGENFTVEDYNHYISQDHIYELTGEVTEDHICEGYPYKEYTCKRCGNKEIEYNYDKEISRDHIYEVTEVETPATCTTKGYGKLKCSRCGYETDGDINYISGDGQHHYILESTEDGKKVYKCQFCDDTYEMDTTEEHNWVEKNYKWRKVWDSDYKFSNTNGIWTSNNAGISYSVAKTVFEITVGEDVDYTLPYGVSSESNYDKLTISLDGNEIINTSGNNTSSTTISLTKGKHTLSVQYSKDKEGNSGKDCGWVKLVAIDNGVTCSICGATCSHEKYGELQSCDPTCEENGGTYYECIVCGHKKFVTTVEPLGHEYTSEVIQETTASQDGKTKFTCSRCGRIYEEIFKASALCKDNTQLEGDLPYSKNFVYFCTDSYYNSEFAIDSDGNIWGWGENSSNKLLLKDIYNYAYRPTQLTQGVKFVKVVQNSYNVYGLAEDGTIWRWGCKYNYGNYLTNDSETNNGSYATEPEKYESNIKFKDITSGYNCGYFVAMLDTDGNVYVSGQGYGIGDIVGDQSSSNNHYVEKLDTGDIKFKKIDIGQDFLMGLTEDGDLWAGGSTQAYGTIADGQTKKFEKRDLGFKVKDINAAYETSYVIDENGDVYAAGKNNNYSLGVNQYGLNYSEYTKVLEGKNIKKIDGEYYATGALSNDGKLYITGVTGTYLGNTGKSSFYEFTDVTEYLQTQYKVMNIYTSYTTLYYMDAIGDCYTLRLSNWMGEPDGDSNYNYNDCRVYLSKANHTFNEVITKEPTCTEDGTKKLVCTDCGLELEVDISKLGHDLTYTKRDTNMDTFTYTLDIGCTRCSYSKTVEKSLIQDNLYELLVNTCDLDLKAIGSERVKGGFGQNVTGDNDTWGYFSNLTDIDDSKDVPLKKVLGAKDIEIGLGYDGNLYSWGCIYSQSYEILRPKNTTEKYIYKPSILSDEHEYVDLMQFTQDLVLARDINNKYYVFGTGYENIVGNSTSSTFEQYRGKEVKPFAGLDIQGIAFTGGYSSGIIFVLKDGKVYSYNNGVFNEFISDHNIIKLRQVNGGQFCALADNGDLIISSGSKDSNSVVMTDLGADDFIMYSNDNFVTLKNNKISKIKKAGATEATDFTTDKTITNCYVSHYGYTEIRLFVVDNKGNVYIAGYNSVNGNSEREEGTNLDLYKLFNVHTGEMTATKFKDKTCTTPEIDTFTCSVCGASYNEGVGTYDHEWEELEVIDESQFGVFRKCKVRCKVCGLEEIHTSEKYDTLDITDWKYTLDEDNDIVNLVEYIGDNPVVNVHSYYYVPATQKWYYTELNNGSTSTFHGNTTIEEVTIDPDTKCDNNSIANLFENCTNLRRVYSVPSCAVNYYFTFANCTSLEEYGEIPSTVTNLGYTFLNCTSLVRVEELPKNIVLDNGSMCDTFNNCTSLENCPGIPLSVTKATYVFYNCSSMKEMCDLSPSLYNIDYAFYNCRNMEVEELNLCNNIESMDSAFAMCNKIKKVGKLPTLKYYNRNTYLDEDGNTVSSKKFYNTFMMCEGLESIKLDVGYGGKSDEFNQQPYVLYKGTFYGCNNIKDIYVTCTGELDNNLGSMLGAYVVMDGNYIDYSMLEDNFEKLWFNREDVTFHYDDTISETYVKYASIWDNSYYCNYTDRDSGENKGTIKVPYIKEDGTIGFERKYIVQFNPVVMQDLKCKFTRDKELSYDENGKCNDFYKDYNTDANDYDYSLLSNGVRINKYIGNDDTLKVPSSLNIKGTDYKVIEINSDFMVGAFVKEVEFDPDIEIEDSYTAGTNYEGRYADAGDEHLWGSAYYDYYSSSGNRYSCYKLAYSEYASKWHNYKDTISGKYIGERVSAKTLLITPYIEEIGYIPEGINIVINESRHLKSDIYLPSTCLGFDDRRVEPTSGLERDGNTSISRRFSSNYPPYAGSWTTTNSLGSQVYYACDGSKYESQLIANVKAEGYEPIKSHRDANNDEICDYCHCLLSLTDWDNHLDLDNNTITLTMYIGESKDVTVPNIISHMGVDYQVILDASYYTFYDTPAENVVIEDGVQFGNYGDLTADVIGTWLKKANYGYPRITYYNDSVSYYKNFNTFRRSGIKNLVLGNTNITNFSKLFADDTTPIENIKLPDNLKVADFMFFSGWNTTAGTGNKTSYTLKTVEYSGNSLISARATFAGCVNMSSFGTFKNDAGVACLDDTFYGCASMKSFADDILPERAESLEKMEGTFRNSGITAFTGNIPVGVKSMYSTFMDCEYLETFDGSLPGTLLLMESTFRDDPIREIVDMPSSVQNIKLCYYNCKNLTTVDSNVTNMSSIRTMQGTFIGCTSIQTVDLSQCVNLEKMEATFGTSGTDDTIEEIVEYTPYVDGRDNWYRNGKPCTTLESVILPDNNGKLVNMDCAFAKCSNLSEISTIPNTVESVINTFYKCTGLSSVKFAENNEKLYKLSHAFYESGLQELEINTNSSLAAEPFNNTVTGCTSLKKMTVNIKYMDSLSNLGSGANIEEFYFSSERLKNLDYAFKGWKKLRVTSPIPSGVVSMVGTFEDCDTLEECPSIPNTVLNMSKCFYDCDYLVHCPEIGDNVEDMSYAFYGCDRLVDAKLGLNALKNTAAFAKCISLSEIEDIDCTNIRKLDYTFAITLAGLSESGNVLNNTGVEDNTPKITKMPNIGEGVEDITGIFAGQTKLVEVSDLPSTVNKLNYAFYGCNSIVNAPKITNKNIVTMYNAFSYCKSLENVEWDNIDTIENMEYAFKECENLKEFNCNIGKVSSMNSTFENCTSLKRVGTINDDVRMHRTFKDDAELETVDFGTLESLKDISEAFIGCSKLNDKFDFTDSSSLSNVEKAFYGCTSLVEAPEFKDDGAITKMHYTFYGCSSLKEAKMPNNVEDMRGTYTNCTSLTKIDKFPDKLRSLNGIKKRDCEFDGTIEFLGIGRRSLLTNEERNRYKDGGLSDSYYDTQLVEDVEYAMNNLDALINYVDGYTGAFSGCTSLIEVNNLPNLSYMNNAFNGCTNLKRVTGKDDGYAQVGDAVGAFLGCNNLEEAKISISGRADYTFANCKKLVVGPESINGNCAVFTFANCEKLENLPKITSMPETYEYNDSRGYTISSKLSYIDKLVGTFYNCKSINGELSVGLNDVGETVWLYRTFENCESLTGTVDLTWYMTSGLKDSDLTLYRNGTKLKQDFKAVSPFKGTKITGVKLGPVDLRYEDTLLKDLPTLEKIEINNDMRDASEAGMNTLGYSYKNSLRNMVWNDDIRGYKPTSVSTSLLGYLNIDTWNAIGRTLGGCDDKAGYNLRYDEGLDAEVTFNIVGKNATAKWYNISNLVDITNDVTKSIETDASGEYFDLVINTANTSITPQRPCIYLVETELIDPDNYALFNNTNRYSLQVGYESQTFGYSYVANNEDIGTEQVLHVVKKDGSVPNDLTVQSVNNNIVKVNKVYYAAIDMDSSNLVNSKEQIVREDGDESSSDYDKLTTTLSFKNLNVDQDDSYYLCYITTNDGVFQTFANPVRLNVNDLVDHLKAEYKGDKVGYGTEYSKDDVVVKAYYTADDVDSEGNDLGVVVPSDYWEVEDNNLVVNESEVVHDNYIEDYAVFEGARARYEVPGFKKVHHMKAVYGGPDIAVGSSYNKNDVSVTLYYTASEGEDADKRVLGNDEWTVSDNDLVVYRDELTEDMNIIDTAVYSDTDNPNVTADYEVPAYMAIDHLTAEYDRPYIPYGESYDKDNVTVKAFFSADENDYIELSSDKWSVEDNDVTVLESDADADGKITDTAVYTDEHQTKSAQYKVQGYKKVDHMKAVYSGPDIAVGEQYNKDDVDVTLYYDVEENESKQLASSEWAESSLLVTTVSANDYTATYEDAFQKKTADYEVNGYRRINHITAVYNGPEIAIGEQYNKDDVTVKICYTESDTEDFVELTSSEWTENSLNVTLVGDNTYTATYTDEHHDSSAGLTANYVVPGYKKIHHMKAEYKGDDIPTGQEYNKDDVEVTLYYTEDESDSADKKVLTSSEWTESGLEVSLVGSNEYTASYVDAHHNLSDEYNVNGFKLVDHMKAIYDGPIIGIGHEYDREDVTVTLYYNAEETDYKVLTLDEWEVEDGSLIVNSSVENEVAVYNDTEHPVNSKSAGYIVNGYKVIDRMTAEYKGDDIPIGSNYSKDDVEVTIYYENETDGVILGAEDWEVEDGSLKVNSTNEVENAIYEDDYQRKEADYNVPGYKKIDHLKAEYTGENILIGEEYNKEDVEVYLCYDVEENDTLKLDTDDWSIKDNSKLISTEGNNDDYAVYVDEHHNLEAKYTIIGYKPEPIVDHIEAVYNGPDIQIVNNYLKSDVEVKVYYSNYDNVDTLGVNDWNESSLVVDTVGENVYTATYKGKTASYSVTGIDDALRLDANYNGVPIKVGEQYSKDDVLVEVVYKSGNRVAVNKDDWTESSLDVTVKGENDYTASYNGMIADYSVDGIDYVIGIKAEYKGEPVPVKDNYNKDDVEVSLLFRVDEPYILDSSQWEESGLKVEIVGDNEYTATYGELSDTYIVNGIDHVKNITAEYTGEDIDVGNKYNKDDVDVYLVYYEKPSEKLNSSEWVESSLDVSKIGTNSYTATYENFSDNYEVIGLDHIKDIEAEYKGKPIKVGDKYNKEDVEVNLVYVSGKKVKAETASWSEDSLDVTKKGTNTYTATYNGMTDTYEVDGIDYITGIKAEYKGEEIPVKKEYNKDDVEVKLLFKVDDPYKLESEQWDESSLVVDKVGDNEYVATYEEFTDTYNVIGKDHAKSIDAEYKGEDIPTGNNYNKDDVEVTVNYYEKPSETVSSNDWSESSLLVSKVGKNDYLATYEECTDTYEVTGLDHEKNIEAIYKGDPVQVGEKYNKDDVEVKVNYYEKDSEILKSKDWKESSLDVVNTGENKYTATYKDMTSEYTVEGKDDIDKIEARYTGEPVNVKEEYKKEEVEVKLVYKSGKEETLKPEDWKESSLVVEKVGDNEYKATYKEFEDTYVVDGKDHIKDLSATYVGDPVLVSKNYNKNDVKVVASYYEKKPQVIDSVDWKESSLLVQVRGSNDYTATYDGMTANYNVTGIDNVKGIDAEYTGEPVPINEEYDKEDVEVKLVYENSDPEVIDTDDWTESSLIVSTVGENKFTATYKEFEDDYTVIGYDDTITVKSIKGTYPEKVLVGEEFNENKAKIVVTYSDGTKQKLKYKYLDVKPESKEVKQVGDNKYTIGYKGAEGSLIVEGYDVDKIIAKYDGPNIEVGKDYSKRDVTVTVVYTDGSEKKLGSDEFETSSMTVTKEGENSYDATWKNYIGKFSVIGVISRPSEKIVDNSQPKTGDSSMLWLAIIVMVSSVIILLYELRKRISYKKK